MEGTSQEKIARETPRHPAQGEQAPRSESSMAREGSLRELEGRRIPSTREAVGEHPCRYNTPASLQLLQPNVLAWIAKRVGIPGDDPWLRSFIFCIISRYTGHKQKLILFHFHNLLRRIILYGLEIYDWHHKVVLASVQIFPNLNLCSKSLFQTSLQ